MNFEERPDVELLTRNRRIRQLACAFLQRAKEASIPSDMLRIDEKTFAGLLCSNYHNNPKEFASSVYGGLDFIQKKFIVIDGGPSIPTSRKMAGCAILFLFLTSDKRGIYIDCEDLRHKFYSVDATAEIARNDLVEAYKSYDILFLSEVDRTKFNPHFESGSYFDEILNYRSDNCKPTIISFYNPIGGKSDKSKEQLAAEGKMDLLCGKFLSALSFEDKDSQEVLRIRVKTI